MRSHRGLCKLLVPPSFAQPRWSCRLDLHVNSNKMGYKWDVKNTLSNVRSFGGLDLLLNIGHVTGLHLKVIKNRDESLYWNLYEPFVLRFTSPCEGCELLLNIHQCSVLLLLKSEPFSPGANLIFLQELLQKSFGMIFPLHNQTSQGKSTFNRTKDEISCIDHVYSNCPKKFHMSSL